jgi:hypothetical protein
MPVRAAAIVSAGLLVGMLSGGGRMLPTAAPLRSAADLWLRAMSGAARPAVIRGRVLLPDDGSPRGLRAWLSTPTHFDSADVDATGAFTLALPQPDCDSIDILFDASPGFARRYHPARLRVPVPRPGDTTGLETIRVLLVPTSFTVEAGTYAGATVPIDVDAAVAGPRERARYWRISRFAQSRGVPVGWPVDRFPIPLSVFGRSAPMRSADSATFWAVARQLEQDVGRTLFRPISQDSAESEGWSIRVTVDPAEESAGITFITYDGVGDVYEATIAIRSSMLLADSRVVSHELMHALGFGHSVGWSSVMGGPNQSATRATASDVAYAQLFYRMRRVYIEQHATHGVLETAAEARRRMPISVSRRGCPLGAPAT